MMTPTQQRLHAARTTSHMHAGHSLSSAGGVGTYARTRDDAGQLREAGLVGHGHVDGGRPGEAGVERVGLDDACGV